MFDLLIRGGSVVTPQGVLRTNIAVEDRQMAAIEVGSIADFALVDLDSGQHVNEESMHQRHRISAYAGSRFRGVVKRTIRRGETIYAEGTFTARTRGRLVRPSAGKERNASSRIHS